VKLVVLGLSLSSSWGNGHATTYRALLKAFAGRGHSVTFLERDQPWYAEHRDLPDPDWCRLAFYADPGGLAAAANEIASADAIMIGSYVADGTEVIARVHRWATGVCAFYDIDTPITLARLEAGNIDYLSADDIPDFDLYFSFTGGPTLDTLQSRWHARRAVALYCSVDPDAYPPLDMPERWALSYLGTWSSDRQPALERLLIAPARARPDLCFAVAGPLYPDGIDWPANVERIPHVSPADHPAFYAASRITLNVTREDMRNAGWSPSVRLFEAAACARPILSDRWPGLDQLFVPETEILLATSTADVIAALYRRDVAAIGRAARMRVLREHSADVRAAQLETELLAAGRPTVRVSRPKVEA